MKSEQFMTYRYSSATKPAKKRRRKLPFVSFILLILIVLGVFIFHDRHPQTAKANPIIKSNLLAPLKGPSTSSNSAAITAMSNNINNIISSNAGIDISVNLIDLNNNQALHYGVNQTFQAASTAKILTAEYFLHEVETGQQSLSETVNGNTAKYELQQMIVVSDDDAWADLNQLLGYTNLQNYATSALGITDFQAYNNVASSPDIAVALQKLWNGSLLNSSDTTLLLSYLKQANYRQYIVPAVPSSDTIYHKIGLYEDYVHDAAIITDGNKAFVIVIYTNGNGAYNWPQRAITMQQITKAALKAYFNQ